MCIVDVERSFKSHWTDLVDLWIRKWQKSGYPGSYVRLRMATRLGLLIYADNVTLLPSNSGITWLQAGCYMSVCLYVLVNLQGHRVTLHDNVFPFGHCFPFPCYMRAVLLLALLHMIRASAANSQWMLEEWINKSHSCVHRSTSHLIGIIIPALWHFMYLGLEG